ncbi:MAG: hypothetical protein JOZ81_29490 [Chloroflexi bacterium]|nr:hypothetical protein [Chloroflexota bacterium]
MSGLSTARLRGFHLLAFAGIVLGALTVRATEVYTTQYQTLPVMDWLESRPPLVESAGVPPAIDLVRALPALQPMLVIRDDARPLLPIFGPPGSIQRTMGGVRDAARIQVGTPDVNPSDPVPAQVRLDAIVFNRSVRAEAWQQLISSTLGLDFRDPDEGLFQVRLSGPDDRDGVWLAAPKDGGQIATIAGHRGTVAFQLRVYCRRANSNNPQDQLDLSARAERIARESAGAWTAWLDQQIGAA